MDDGKGWLKLSIASENTLGVKKTYDVQNYGGIGHSSLSLYQRSCPFKDTFIFYLHLWDNQGMRCSNGRQMHVCAVEFL